MSAKKFSGILAVLVLIILIAGYGVFGRERDHHELLVSEASAESSANDVVGRSAIGSAERSIHPGEKAEIECTPPRGLRIDVPRPGVAVIFCDATTIGPDTLLGPATIRDAE
jgi:hypothetical protein